MGTYIYAMRVVHMYVCTYVDPQLSLWLAFFKGDLKVSLY